MAIPSAACSRRSVLAAGAGFAVLSALAGCSSPSAPVPALPPSADEDAVQRAVVPARALHTQALALAAAGTTFDELLQRVAAGHLAHLAALGAPVADPATGSASPAASASASASASTAADAPTPARQITAEWAAAREALRDGIGADSAGLAVLLTRIAAARAVHADLIAAKAGRPEQPGLEPAAALAPVSASSSSPASSAASATPLAPATSAAPSASTTPSTVLATGSPDATPTELSDPQDAVTPRALATASTAWLIALDRLLAGEHAAVFAYPLVIARLTGRDRARAQKLWQQHQTSRNELTEILLAAQVQPATAAAAYDTGGAPGTPSAARRLAARVELGLAGLAGDAMAAALGAGDRALAADALTGAARRSASWSDQPTALPGRAAPAPASATPGPSGTSAGPVASPT